MHTLTIRLTDDQWEALRSCSYTTRLRYNTIVSQAVTEALLAGGYLVYTGRQPTDSQSLTSTEPATTARQTDSRKG